MINLLILWYTIKIFFCIFKSRILKSPSVRLKKILIMNMTLKTIELLTKENLEKHEGILKCTCIPVSGQPPESASSFRAKVAVIF